MTSWSPAAPTKCACQVSSAAMVSASSAVTVASFAAPEIIRAWKMAATARGANASSAATAARRAAMAKCAPLPTARARTACVR